MITARKKGLSKVAMAVGACYCNCCSASKTIKRTCREIRGGPVSPSGHPFFEVRRSLTWGGGLAGLATTRLKTALDVGLGLQAARRRLVMVATKSARLDAALALQ